MIGRKNKRDSHKGCRKSGMWKMDEEKKINDSREEEAIEMVPMGKRSRVSQKGKHHDWTGLSNQNASSTPPLVSQAEH